MARRERSGPCGKLATAALIASTLLSGACGGSQQVSTSIASGRADAGDSALTTACENPNGYKVIEPGEPPVAVFAPVEAVEAWRRCLARGGPSRSGSSNLSYHGGTSDGTAGNVGVEVAPAVFLVFWGSQWGTLNGSGLPTTDPSGEASILEGFFSSVGNSGWANDNTQYCEGVASGTYSCPGTTPTTDFAGNDTVLAGTWLDDGAAAPSAPKQSQLAAEAVRAAQHFASLGYSNANAQYVIATASGNNSTGFGHQYCAWHSSTTSSSYGDIAYTNLPYITDAGSSCGANFNGLGPNAGITIVGGHEFAETVTDPFPSSGWLDSAGSETGDKCAWISSGQGAATYADFGPAPGYPVQSLWSNAQSECLLSYPPL